MTLPVLEGVVSTEVDDTVISVTFSHTVPSMSDGILIVNATWNNRELQTVDTVTFDGDDLVFIGQVTEDDDTRVEQWRLLAPAAKTANVVVTLTAALATDEGICCAAMNFSSVDQTVPVGNIATASASSGTDATVDISSAVGELILDGAGTEDAGGPLVVGSGQTQRYNLASPVVGPRQEFSGGSTELGATTVTMSWTLDASDRWGTIAIELLGAITPVPPTVDAGGPYNGPSGQATALDATVVAGTDPTPVLLWTIDSGGAGSFSNDAIEDPTFTPTFPTVGPYVLRLTVTPSDGPAVFDTANFESDAVAPTVDAGGPYAGDVATPIALNGTVTPGTDPAPTLLWTIDSGGTGTFSDDTIEDPDFTADGIGAYVLRLTVTPSDGPDVFDTAALTTAALADAVFLGGRLLRGGTGDLVMSQLALGADPPGGDVVFIKGTAHSNAGAMYVALDDGVVSRVHIAGIAHQQNGVRLVTFNPPLVSLNAWGLDANGAQGVATSGAGQPHEGVLLRGDGQMVVDGVAPPPIAPPALANLIHYYDFDDLSTLWQDLAATIPVTTVGQSIQRVDDKGSFGTFLTDASVGQFRSPFWGFSNGTGEYSSPVGGFNKVLSSQISPGSPGEITMAWVADRDATDTGTANVATWQAFNGIAIDQFSANNIQGFTNGVGINGLFIPRTLIGAMLTHRLPDVQELRDSTHSGFLSAVNASFVNPIANQDLSVGAESFGSGADWRGIIKAVYIWNKGLTAQEIQDFKDFTTAKFGVAWA